MNFNNDNSSQITASIQSNAGNYIGVVYSNVLNSYQTTLIPSTILYGIGSNLTLVNYLNLSNLPNLTIYASNSSLSSYQTILTSTSNINVNNINSTGTITGTLSGTATGLSGTPNITVGTVSGTTINASGNLQESGSNLSAKYLGINSTSLLASNLTGNPNINVNNINSTGTITGTLSGTATGLSGTPNITVGTVSGTTINASGNLQESGSNLSIKYLGINSTSLLASNLTGNPNINVNNINSTGTITGTLSGTATGLSGTPNITVGTVSGTTISASGNLQEGGSNLSIKYLGINSTSLLSSNLTGNPNINVGNINSTGTITGTLSGTATGLSGTPNITVGTVSGTTISASGNLQEGGTNLTSKYLQLSGGTITGALTVPNITLGSGGKINSYDDYHFIQISQPTDTLTIQEYGKIIFSIGITKTEVARINSTGLTVSGTLNATTLQQGGTPISTLISTATSSYLPLTGGTLTGTLTINNSTTSKLIFNDALQDIKLQLYGGYGLGIQANTLLYSSLNTHKFMAGVNQTMILDSSGNLTTLGTITNGASSYLFAGGLRIGGWDANTLYNGTNPIGITALNKINFATGTSLANYATRMTVDTNGNVGIGIASPNCKLEVGGVVNFHNGSPYATLPTNNFMQSGSLTIGGINANYGNGNSWTGNTAGLLMECLDNTEIAVHDSGHRLASLISYLGGGTNQIRIGRDMGWNAISSIYLNGNVGIGRDPQYKLDVNGDVRVSGWYYNDNNISLKGGLYITNDRTITNYWQIYIAQAGTANNSLIFQHIATGINSLWYFNGTQSSTFSEISDERVKKEIEEINNPLDKLLKLKPKQYYLCSDKDYEKKYGIIAQDVEKDLQEFVFTDTEYIANIYSYAKYDNKIITFNKDISKLINIDDELKIVLDNNDKNNLEIVIDDTPYNNRYKKRYVKVLNVIDEYSIEIDIEIPETDIFVYGKKVNDFKKLDYDSLYCLNIKATQELHKIIIQQQEQINYLLSKIS